MSLAEKYRPRTESEIIGNGNAIIKLKGVLHSRGRAYLYGDPGIGKTSSVFALANDLGLHVIELNASDARRKGEIDDLARRVAMRTFKPVVYLVDEVDGMSAWGALAKAIAKSKHPIILIANRDDKVPKKVKNMCTRIRFYRPRVDEVARRIRQIAEAEGIANPDMEQVTEDVRSSINAVFYGGMGREITDQFKRVQAVFTGGGVSTELKPKDLIWILDNAHRFLYGVDLAHAIELVEIAAKCRDTRVLEAMPRGVGTPQFPYFLRRISVMRRGKK